jgi:hypothetical protein
VPELLSYNHINIVKQPHVKIDIKIDRINKDNRFDFSLNQYEKTLFTLHESEEGTC